MGKFVAEFMHIHFDRMHAFETVCMLAHEFQDCPCMWIIVEKYIHYHSFGEFACWQMFFEVAPLL